MIRTYETKEDLIREVRSYLSDNYFCVRCIEYAKHYEIRVRETGDIIEISKLK